MKKASAKPPAKPPAKPAAKSAAKSPAKRRAGGHRSADGTGRRDRRSPADPDEIAPEYDFRGARPNPYAARYAAGATAVVLDPDVAAAFPSAARVNEVLRAVAGIIQAQSPAKPRRSRRSA
jgi:hypothetical protein